MYDCYGYPVPYIVDRFYQAQYIVLFQVEISVHFEYDVEAIILVILVNY